MDTPRTLTKQEVADLFRVSIKTVERWGHLGILRPIKVHGAVRYMADEVDALLKNEASA